MLDKQTKDLIKTATVAVIDAMESLPQCSADADTRVTRAILARVKADLILLGKVRNE